MIEPALTPEEWEEGAAVVALRPGWLFDTLNTGVKVIAGIGELLMEKAPGVEAAAANSLAAFITLAMPASSR